MWLSPVYGDVETSKEWGAWIQATHPHSALCSLCYLNQLWCFNTDPSSGPGLWFGDVKLVQISSWFASFFIDLSTANPRTVWFIKVFGTVSSRRQLEANLFIADRVILKLYKHVTSVNILGPQSFLFWPVYPKGFISFYLIHPASLLQHLQFASLLSDESV